jgi:beta-lactamase superfamily II metal-dependent hydrolase
MSSEFALPKKGFVFWPVGCGDSTTIVVNEDIVMQIDLRGMAKAAVEKDPAIPVVDQLIRLLPKKNNKPYLAVFALTHPDDDHIHGFQDLLEKVTIGEIWHTPRIFRDYEDEIELCEAAEAFRKEVHRRRQAVIDNPNDVKAGDRVRVIGHDDILNEDKYKNFPKERTSMPGTLITTLDDCDVSDSFEAFVHAPFKIDPADSRNNTSLSLHVTLRNGAKDATALFFGDREYPTTKMIFDVTIAHDREQYLSWDVLLSPHHCSKRTMYWKDDGENETFKKDIMDQFENYARSAAYIVASANCDFTDGEGDNPPHSKARTQYEKIIDAGHFLCTHEHSTAEDPKPICFELSDSGFVFSGITDASAKSALSAAVASGRGGDTPPQQQVGFGTCS